MIVSLLGLVISLFAYLIAFPGERARRFDIYAALLALHIIAAIGFWLQSFESAMDAFMYYRDPYGYINHDPLESGTIFIVHLTQGMRNWLGGSFFDHFLFYQCFGMIGVALLIRSLNEVAEALDMGVPIVVYLMLFLPGLHFWTAGIGKDSPMMMAICLATWSAIRIEKRVAWMVLALAIMACVRPHIMPFVVAGMFAAVMISRRTPPRLRLVLAPFGVMGILYFLAKAASSLNIETVSVDSFSNFVDQQQSYGDTYGSGANLDTLPLPFKMFTLMFRPFWYDAGGIMGYAASLENTVLLGLTLYLIYNWKVVWHLSRDVMIVPYCTVFVGLLILSLSMVSYNVGLGQRMKMMAIPTMLLLIGIVVMYNRAMARRVVLPEAQPEGQASGETSPARV